MKAQRGFYHWRSPIPWPGRHYRCVYGYPVRWAILTELAWRLEHYPAMPWAREDKQSRLRSKGYVWRKAAERRGSPLL